MTIRFAIVNLKSERLIKVSDQESAEDILAIATACAVTNPPYEYTAELVRLGDVPLCALCGGEHVGYSPIFDSCVCLFCDKPYPRIGEERKAA